MSKNATIRLQDETHEFLKSNFEGIQSGISLIVEPFDRLLRITISELKGFFTREELIAILDSQNGVMLTPDFIYNKAFWVAQLEDFEMLENGISKHGAVPNDLFAKIKTMPSVQVYYFIIDIHLFWNSNRNMNAYLDKLV